MADKPVSTIPETNEMYCCWLNWHKLQTQIKINTLLDILIRFAEKLLTKWIS